MFVLIQILFTLTSDFSVAGTVCMKELVHVSKQLFY